MTRKSEMPTSSNLLPCTSCRGPARWVCTLCQVTPYCCEDCSGKHWPQHRAYCLSICDPPGLCDATPQDAAVQGIGNDFAALVLSKASLQTKYQAPELATAAYKVQTPPKAAKYQAQASPTAAKYQAQTPPTAAKYQAPTPLLTSPIAAYPTATSAVLAESKIWENCEHLSDAEFTKVLVTATGFQELWVNVFRNGTSIIKLHADLNTAAATFQSCVPCVGKTFAGCYDGQWCRVKVTAVTPTLTVRYLDYGNEEPLNLRDLRVLPGTFTALPAQAIRMRIANATQSKYEKFKTDSWMFVKRVAMAADGCYEVVVEGDEPVKPIEVPVQEVPSDKFTQVVVLESGATSMLVNLASQGAAMIHLTQRLARVLPSLPLVTSPTLGQLVAAKFQDDSGIGWYRACVTGSNPSRVRFLDFGNEAEMSAGGMKSLPTEFHAMPAQAVPIRLAAGTDQRFQALPVNATLRVRAVGKADGFVIVEPEDLEVRKPVERNADPLPREEQHVPCLQPASVVPGTRQDVFWVHRQGVDGFVQKRDPDNLLLSLSEPMKLAAEATTPVAAVDGVAVLALFEGEWARAAVVSSRPELRIRFLDYGNEMVAPPSELRPMPESLAQVPAQCWKVRLSGDTSLAVSQLNEYSVFSGTFLSQGVDSVWTLRGEIAQ